MIINFLKPWYLLLIPICFTFIIYFSREIYGKLNKIVFTSLRSIIIILVILSLAGTTILNFTNITTTIFAVDISASAKGNKEDVLNFITESQRTRDKNDSIGLIAFGKNAVVDSNPGLDNKIEKFDSVVEENFTNISEGLKLANSLIPQDTKKRVVLFSDGQENIEDASFIAKIFKEQNISLNIVPLKPYLENEVQLTEINIPKSIKKGVNYEIEVVGHSLIDTETKLTIYRNQQVISDEIVTFRKGENKFIIKDKSDKSGGVTYRAEITPAKDTFLENNKVYSYSRVEGEPNILIIDNNGNSTEVLSILENTNVSLTQRDVLAAPSTIEEINNYDAVILVDVALEKAPKSFAENIESYVKNFGGGLLVTGGTESYGLGDYKGTPLERALPVEMDVKDENEEDNVGILVLLDRSGSMGTGKYGISKLELAKESVIRSAETLKEGDYFGVMAFDDAAIWASPYEELTANLEAIKTSVANISLGGGTSILPSLQKAYELMLTSDTKIKHIILLTDGQAETSGYDSIITGMNNNNITLSTIAVGSDSDIKLLQRLAKESKGRYYYSDEFTDLPKIFAKETQVVGKDYLNNEGFYPKIGEASPILNNIDSLPLLGGYISTTAKNRADKVLLSEKDEVIIASWQYGLGKSVAWTTDIYGMWTENWLNSEAGIDIFKNAVSWIVKKQESGDIKISAKTAGDLSLINISIPYFEGITSIKSKIVSADLTEHEVDFEVVAPGEYVGTVMETKEGAYIANIEIETFAGTENIITGLSIPYSEEYDLRKLPKGEEFLKKLAYEANGNIIKEPSEVFLAETANVEGSTDISSFLLIVALVLLILDIAVRRFYFITDYLQRIVDKFLERRKIAKDSYNFQTNIKKNTVNVEGREREEKSSKNLKHKSDKETKNKKEISYTSDALVSKKKKRSGR